MTTQTWLLDAPMAREASGRRWVEETHARAFDVARVAGHEHEIKHYAKSAGQKSRWPAIESTTNGRLGS